MEILKEEIYINKTWKYLIPAFKSYGSEFVIRMNSMFKVAVGLYDMNCKTHQISLRNPYYVFICVNPNINGEYLSDFITNAKREKVLVKQYPINVGFDCEMLIIKFPKNYSSAYLHFLKGEYHKMYSNKDIDKLFNSEMIRNVLLGNQDIRGDYLNKINLEFGTFLTLDTFKNPNVNILDLPLKYDEEVFNYKGKQCFMNIKEKIKNKFYIL